MTGSLSLTASAPYNRTELRLATCFLRFDICSANILSFCSFARLMCSIIAFSLSSIRRRIAANSSFTLALKSADFFPTSTCIDSSKLMNFVTSDWTPCNEFSLDVAFFDLSSNISSSFEYLCVLCTPRMQKAQTDLSQSTQ